MTTNGSRLCSQCRSPINASMKSCSACGAQLSTAPAEPSERRMISGVLVILVILIGGVGGYLFKDFLYQPAWANDEPLTAPETATPNEIPLIDPADLPVLPTPAEVSREVAGMGDHPEYVVPDEPIEYDGSEEPLDVAGMGEHPDYLMPDEPVEYDGGEEPLDVAGMGEHPDYLMPDEPIEYDDGSTEIFEDSHAKDQAIGRAPAKPKDTHLQETPHKSLQDYIDTGNRHYREKNYAMAVIEIEQAANMGHADSQRFMGEMYRDGKGVPQDYSKAHEWYEVAASNNSASAMYALALFYWEGNGVTKDIQKARSLFLQAANLGDARAQYNLGMIYKMGWGVEKDHYESFRWVEMAANQNLAEALYAVGYDYEHGEGIEKDMNRALAYYRKAADLGEVRAIKKMKAQSKNVQQFFDGVYSEDIAIIKEQLNNGVDVNAVNDTQQTALHVTQNADVARLLIERGGDIHAKDDAGMTPVFNKTINIAAMLLDAGANINARSEKGNTPFSWYTYSGYLDGLRFLVSRGADVNACNTDNQNALNIAAHFHPNTDVLEYLQTLDIQSCR